MANLSRMKAMLISSVRHPVTSSALLGPHPHPYPCPHPYSPDTNILIVHPKHDFHPGGTKGVDWFHEHKEVDIQVGGTIGYEVYGFQDGWVKRYGDGGYINWAWNGVLARDPEEDKSKITFQRRKK